MFGKTCGLKPKVIFWIYTGCKTHSYYAATVWWPRVKTSQAELGKLQRMAWFGIKAAMRTAAIEVLLGLPSLHLRVEAEAKAGITDYVAMTNGNQNLKVLDMHT
jgi:hypothetical protein